MFQTHFQLDQMPFERGIASTSLYESSQVAEAMARMLYACEHRSIAVLTGEIGAGKSTLLRLLKQQLDTNRYMFLYVASSQLTPKAFYTLVLNQLGVTPPYHLPKLKATFQAIVEDYFQNKGTTCVIAIDEAQEMELPMIKEIRFLMNFRSDSYSPMALLLVGQTELRSMLQALYMKPIRRRVETFFHLEGMSPEETKAYIEHQLAAAGAQHALFPDDVINRIFEHSRGIASTVNTLCKRCLFDAASRKQKLVDLQNLERAAKDLF